MAEQIERFRWVAKLSLILVIVTVAVVVVVSGGQVVQAVRLARAGGDGMSVAGVALGAVGGLVLAVWAVVAYGLIQVLLANEAGVAEAAGRVGRVETLLDEIAESTRKLTDLASLSDKAKSYLYREHELEALRETIHHDIMRQDYAAAGNLIDAMAKEFGYADEAARLRQEVEASRKATTDEKVDAQVRRIQQIVERRDWGRAKREAERLTALFPSSEKAAALPRLVQASYAKHKRELLQAYGQAVAKNDVDRGIELLRELDPYLTPQEAAALEESARGVFRAKLHNFGVRFAIAVTDQRWDEALATGEEIIREYPNSRMAQEVRQKLDQLRARVTEMNAASRPTS